MRPLCSVWLNRTMNIRRHPTSARNRIVSIGTGLAMLCAGTVIGATTQHFASASVSTGERAVLVAIEPCRLADTRSAPNTVGARSVPIGPADTHTVNAQQASTACTGKIPTDASALSLNVTALGATQTSFITIWASGDRPTAASLNPAPGQPPVPNAVTTALSANQQFQLYNNAGSVHIVVDVNGYYVDHNHDDRYYTEAEADAAFLSQAKADARYYTEAEADAAFLSQAEGDARYSQQVKVDEVHLSAPDFNPGGTGTWEYSNLTWTHTAGGTRECMIASVDVPVGRSVTSVNIRYSGTTAATVDVLVGSTSRSPMTVTSTGDFIDVHLINSNVAFPATGGSVISEMKVTIDSGDIPPGIVVNARAVDHEPLLELCTMDGFSIIGATVVFS